MVEMVVVIGIMSVSAFADMSGDPQCTGGQFTPSVMIILMGKY